MSLSKRIAEDTGRGTNKGGIQTFVEVKGLGNVVSSLKAAAKGNPRIFTQIVNNAGKRVEDLIKTKLVANGSSRSGLLADSIRTFPSKVNPYFLWVGPDYRQRSGPGGGHHAHLVEYGTKERYMKKGLLPGGFTRSSGGAKKFTGFGIFTPTVGKATGKAPAKPFIRPVYDEYGDAIIDMLIEDTWKAIKDEATKTGILT